MNIPTVCSIYREVDMTDFTFNNIGLLDFTVIPSDTGLRPVLLPANKSTVYRSVPPSITFSIEFTNKYPGLSVDTIANVNLLPQGQTTVWYSPKCGYSFKQYAVITRASSTFTLSPFALFSIPSVGFTDCAFGTPYKHTPAKITFYENMPNYTLVPAVPFQILNADGDKYLQLVSTKSAFKLVFQKKPGTIYCFQPSIPGHYQLCALSTTKWVPLQLASNGEVTTASIDKISGQWGILQNYNPSIGDADGVMLFTTNGTSQANVVVNASDTVSMLPLTTANVLGWPSAFAQPGAGIPKKTSAIFRLQLLSPTVYIALRDASVINCWDITALGCDPGSIMCTIGSTNTGAYACNGTSNKDKSAQQSFVQNKCGALMTGRCGNVAGAPAASSCSGFKQTDLIGDCEAACTSLNTAGDTVTCDKAKTDFCQAHPDLPDCACLNVYTNPLKLPLEGNLSYPEYACYLQQKYKISPNTELHPKCWWKACDNNPLVGALTSDTLRADVPCPDTLTECITLISNINQEGEGSVGIRIDSSCGTITDNSHIISCAPSSTPAVLVPPKPKPPTPATPTSLAPGTADGGGGNIGKGGLLPWKIGVISAAAIILVIAIVLLIYYFVVIPKRNRKLKK